MKAMITYPCHQRVDALTNKLIQMIVAIDALRAEAKQLSQEMAPEYA